MFKGLRLFLNNFSTGSPRAVLVFVLVLELVVAPVLVMVKSTIQNSPTAAGELRFDNIGKKPLSASACAWKTSAFECKVINDDGYTFYAMPESIAQAIPFKDAADVCTGILIDQLNLSGETQLPEGYSKTINIPLGTCYLKLDYVSSTEYKLDGDLSLIIPGGSYPTSYKDEKIATDGNQRFATTLGHGKAKFDLKIAMATRGEWASLGFRTFDYEGDFSGPVTLDLTGVEDLGDYLVDQPGLDIDEENSQWTLETTGKAEAELSFTFDSFYTHVWNINVIKFTFCPIVCVMTTTEKQIIKAKKKINGTDLVVGNLYSKKVYTDTYKGTGSTNINTLSARWNEDLEIKKERLQEWNNDLGEVCAADLAKEIAKWQYTGKVETNALHLPLQQNRVTIEDTVKKNLNFTDTDLRTLIKGGGDKCEGLALSGAAAVDKKESTVRIDGKTQDLKREGPGSKSFSQAAINYNMSGAYDNLDPELLVKASTEPDEIGKRLGPFGKSNEEYTKSYLGDQFLVKGLFTVSFGDATASVIKTADVIELPKVLVITNAFNSSDSKAFRVNESISAIKKAAKKVNLPVLVFSTQNYGSFISAMNNVRGKSGVVWAHFGHGVPTGLAFPEEEADYILFSELRLRIEQARVKFQVVFGNTCYFGHQPIAQTYGANLGIGIGDKLTGHIGHLFGIDKNTIQSTGDAILGQIMAYLGQCQR